ncbi:uncharacterized protein LOC123220444 isoform X2 [Mangifera indica]|uniref:uncharacterized protein LOC123220444 isoform X2 n=1 Tax=Mangifera indica TaxID=29780 RepID=UPI001CFB1920|nr:uncharacterized protein LOC123220444 isoform X2 [Mangifera indica]
MDEYHCKRSGQIPAFGNWDYSNNLPITQYFESARQAGLLRYSSSSGESDLYVRRSCGGRDLPAGDSKKPSRSVNGSLPRKTRVGEKRGPQVKEQKKQQQVKKVCDNHVTQPPRKQPPPLPRSKYGVVTPTQPPVRPPKAVDEDLYKIPPELLHSHNNRKMTGFFSCLVPACAS